MYNKKINLKLIIFILVIFPYLMYVYGSTITMVYFSNLILMSSLSLLVLFLLGFKNSLDPSWKIFIPLLLVMSASILLSYQVEKIQILVKNFLFLLIFYTTFSFHFNKFLWYKLFVSIVTVLAFFSIVSYLIYFTFDYVTFEVSDIKFLLSEKSAFLLRDWGYKFLYLFFVISADQENGILGVPRMLGLSHEPTVFAALILPTIYMAFYFKKYISMSILFIALILSSSYGSLFFFLIGLLYIIFYKHKLYLTVLLLIPIVYFLYNIDLIINTDNQRAIVYASIVKNFLNLNFTDSLLKGINADEVEGSLDVPAILYLWIQFGFLSMIGYAYIIYKYTIQIIALNNKFVFAFFISMILIINKNSMAISPLFLFYLGFINLLLVRPGITTSNLSMHQKRSLK